MGPFRQLLDEIRERPVWQLIGLYLGASWVALQVIDVLAQNMDLPASVFPSALVLLAIGLVVVFVTALLQRHAGPPGSATRARLARLFTWRNVAGGGIIAFAMWGVVSAALVLAPRGESDVDPSSGNTLAVLPFTFQGSPDLAYLGVGLVDLLSTKLDGAGDLRAVDPRAILSLVGDEVSTAFGPRDGARVAEQVGADLFILGSIVHVGDRLTLNVGLYDTSTDLDPVVEASETGTTEGVFESVDQLAAHLLGGLAMGPAARVQRVATVSTSSLPALRAYLEGERFYRLGQYGAAVRSFQEAVRLDPTYAVAYYRLSVVAEFSTLSDLAQESAELAVRYADRLSQRDRRLLDAFVAWRRGAHTEAERLYRGLVRSYPDEVEAWFELGEVLIHGNPLHGRSFVEAREAFSRALDLDPQNTAAMYHLARIASVSGPFRDLDSLVALHNRLNPGGDRELEVLALQAFSRPQPRFQAEILDRLQEGTDVGVALAGWDASTWTKDAVGARQVVEVLTDASRPPEVQGLGHAWLAQIELARGRMEAASGHLDRLERLDPVGALEYRALLMANPLVQATSEELEATSSALAALDADAVPPSQNPSIFYSVHDDVHPLLRNYLLGLIHALAGDSDEALDQAVRTAETPTGPAEGTLSSDLAASIRAQVHLRGGRPAAALAELESIRREVWYIGTLVSPFYGQALERFVRAELLYQEGRLEESAAWFGTISQIAPYELAFRGLAFERLAQIHDALGDAATARTYYRDLMQLWGEADVALTPRVEAARVRLSELEQR